ncbi:tyrosine-type recombinase/integrase [Streptomyces sp. NPDC056192]|uniref:tyrosine-type recombinase/integrase n=1 Tax=Streptomyces sp. NPDC056192 TaxID=3345743 RepID=UPI0035E30F0F
MGIALPKGGKTRTVPLPESVARSLDQHITQQPPTGVSLPWRSVDGSPVTASVLFRNVEGRAVNHVTFNRVARRPALDKVGVPRGRENGTHALRHFYVSVLLDAGESTKALSEYLGHHDPDPGCTLRTYTHLMPSGERRTREAVNRAFEDGSKSDDGPMMAQGA